jgi:hypothetical protein
MELGQYQLQIFVSLVVILGAAFVALIVDFLKGNNEQLRELAVELRVRREEEQRRSQTMTAQPMRVGAEAPAAPKPERIEKQVEAPARAMAAPKERKRTASADAIAAMERGAAMAGAPRPKRAPEPQPERKVEVAQAPAPVIAAPTPAPVIEVAPTPAAAESTRRPVALVPKKDWKSLLDKKKTEVRTDLMEAVAAATVSQRAGESNTEFPAGFHEGFVLSQLVQSRKPVSGLVVSIGVNAPRNEDGSLPAPVAGLIQSLIGPNDFACQSSAEEFLLIYPGERGASAQRKLSEIAQQLWDFQLRSLGTFSILFSWGGVEVRSENIEEAIATANERMQETRRGRKLLTMEPREQALREAV